ncbi:chaperone protein dnaJ 8, chloroplastic [Malania oleifera]|uniref:chaperone protein dnaJ 8, chloroplastic n=1 Tax=Malania oleifera TaxID=397392 RepID=UPI0025AE4A3A|nr:chaperone protein dnaJ 8, chloroplastic [Malania oleifera]
MATAVGVIGGRGSSSSSWMQVRRKKEKTTMGRGKVFCVASSVTDPYKTLRIQPGASESEVRKAFRRLALQYHPDVCRGSNCGVEFCHINEAYDIVMSNLRGEPRGPDEDQGIDEPMRGMNDPDWDMWEEWMGWEGAGIRDYSSHINPYI